MGFADRHNKGSKFDIDIEGFEFKSLSELFKRDKGKGVYTMNGVYINRKSKFGAHPVAICEGDEMLVDLPAHMLEDIQDMLASPEDVEDIKNGEARFMIEEYVQKDYNRKCYGIKWC